MRALLISPMVEPYSPQESYMGNQNDVAVMSGELGQALARAGVEVTTLSVIPRKCDPGHRLAQRVSPLTFVVDGKEEEIPVFEGQIDDSSARTFLLSMDPPPLIRLDGDLNIESESAKKARDWTIRFAAACLTLHEEMIFKADVVHFFGDATPLAFLWPQSGELAPEALVLSFFDPQREGVFPAEELVEGLGDLHPSGVEEATAEEGLTAAQRAVKMSSAVVLPGMGSLGQLSFSRRRLALKEALEDHPQVHGIPGGVDPTRFDPSSCPRFEKSFDKNDLSGKAVCKRALQNKLGLAPRDDVMMALAPVGDGVEDGTVHLVEAAPELLKQDLQLLFVGRPSPHLANRLQRLSENNGKRMALLDEDRDVLPDLFAGADLILAAPEWAPWGRPAQLGMALGCVPVVHSTGGLADLVVDWEPKTSTGGGFKFRSASAQELVAAVQRAQEVFENKDIWAGLVKRNLAAATTWAGLAKRFQSLYEAMTLED